MPDVFLLPTAIYFIIQSTSLFKLLSKQSISASLLKEMNKITILLYHHGSLLFASKNQHFFESQHSVRSNTPFDVLERLCSISKNNCFRHFSLLFFDLLQDSRGRILSPTLFFYFYSGTCNLLVYVAAYPISSTSLTTGWSLLTSIFNFFTECLAMFLLALLELLTIRFRVSLGEQQSKMICLLFRMVESS